MIFMPFIGLQIFKVKRFFENSQWSIVLNHLKINLTAYNPLFLHFPQYDPEEVRVLANLFFLLFDYQIIKNPLMLPAYIFAFFSRHFRFLHYFQMFSFLASNNPSERVSFCRISSLLDMYFK